MFKVMRNIYFLLILLVSVAFITSCSSFTRIIRDNAFQHVINKDDLRDYKPTGALVYGTVSVSNDNQIQSVPILFDSAPDLTLYTPIQSLINNTITPFLVDVDFPSKGISKVGVLYNYQGDASQKFMHQKYLFSLKSNDVIIITTNTTLNVKTNNVAFITLKDNTATTNFSQSIDTNIKTDVLTNTSVGSTSKRIYYFGRLVVNLLSKGPTSQYNEYEINYTNTFDYDHDLFIRQYTEYSNSQFIPLDVKYEK